MLALQYITCKCERYQLRMRAISRCKYSKLKSTKIYSKGVLVNHTKISINENFPLYGMATAPYHGLSMLATRPTSSSLKCMLLL